MLGARIMSVVPKRMVTIFGKRVPLNTVIYFMVAFLMIVSLLLPWISYTIIFPPATVKILAVEGEIRARGYLTGTVEVVSDYTIYDANGEASIVHNTIVGYAPGMIVFLVLLIIIISLYLYLGLLEMGKIRIGPRIIREEPFLIETIALILSLVVCLVFVHFRNILGLRLFQNRILSDLEDSMLASGIDISQRYYHASVDWSMQWGPGYMMFFFITIFLFVWYIDKYLFGKVLNLSSYWKARGHLVFISLLMLAFPLVESSFISGFRTATLTGELAFLRGVHEFTALFHISYYVGYEAQITGWWNRTMVEFSPGVFLLVSGLVVLLFIVFILGVTIWPSRHVVKAEPSITLALPDEEILKRHKALPTALVWKKALDWSLSLIAMLVLVILFIGLVKVFGHVIIVALYREYSGSLWTTPAAYVLVSCILVQFLLVLKPTK